MEKRQIGEGRRDGAAKFHGSEVEVDDSVNVTTAAGDGSPITEGECGSPVGHGTTRVGGDAILE